MEGYNVYNNGYGWKVEFYFWKNGFIITEEEATEIRDRLDKSIARIAELKSADEGKK